MYSDLTWHIIKLHHDWHLKQFIKEKNYKHIFTDTYYGIINIY